jgi:hypothetical protein
MKIVFRTVLFHFVCILVFALLYSTFAQDFGSLDDDLYSENNNRTKEKLTFLDFLLLSTTIQAGVGYTLLTPKTTLSKYILMIQQFFMIFTNLMLFYFISL